MKSSTDTVCPEVVIPMSHLPLLTTIPVMVTLVQPVEAGMAAVLSVPPEPLAYSCPPAALLFTQAERVYVPLGRAMA